MRWRATSRRRGRPSRRPATAVVAMLLAMAPPVWPMPEAAAAPPAGSATAPSHAALPAGSPVAPRQAQPRLLGISLDDTAAAIADSLQALGVAQSQERRFANGGIERRYILRDRGFIRAVFPAAEADSRPVYLSFSLPAAAPATLRADLIRQLGKPAWQKSDDGGSTVRAIWGGRGAADAGVIPDRHAHYVTELVTSAVQPPSVTFARPEWFAARGR